MKILLIFDSSELVSLVSKNLQEKGHEVFTSTAEELIKSPHNQIADLSYDVIVFNLFKNPSENYLELYKRIYRDHPTVSILAVTDGDGTAFDDGNNNLDHASIDFEHLNKSIQILLESRYRGAPTKHKVKDIILDSISRKAYRSGVEINLTAKEYNLLEYFMQNPSHALTQDQIMDHLWDPNTIYSSNVLATLIKNLRKKLKDNDNKNPIIETLKGLGYRLNT